MVAPMTSSSTSEVPFFRGKTLTPESPVPVHIPEPANILVLQNQIDPIFNLMSTHVDQPPSSRGQGTTGSSLPLSIIPDVTLDTTVLGGSDAKPTETNHQEEQDYDGDGDNDYIMDLENEELLEDIVQQSSDTLPNLSSSLIQPSAAAASHETHSVPTQNDPSLSSHGQPQDIAGVPLQHSKSPHEPTQSPPASIGQNATTADSRGESNTHLQTVDTDVSDGGVNYQALLDHLSPAPAAAAAPGADPATIPTVVSSEKFDPPRPGSAESPLAALPVPAGLPPRPPPQEKPAIHPNYTPGEDIRSYHYTHTQNSNAHTSYSSQPSNPYRPSQGYPHPATNATVGANGLPPPPIATFQQTPAKAAQSQSSPTAQQPRPNDVQGKNGERSAVSADEGEDDVPWDQEVARKYADFLRDEAVYVTEGLWDRFPQGSRLFVGMSPRLS